MKELIRNLTAISSPSGREEPIRAFIQKELENYCDELKVDTLGNLIAVKHGGKAKLQLAAHMDEIGIIVTAIDKQGFLRFANVGGINPHRLYGQRVRFKDGTMGVIGAEKIDDIKELTLEKLFIDLGVTSEAEAKAKVGVGAMAAFDHSFVDLGHRVIAKALDDRVGCAVLIEALKRVRKPQNDLYCTFTVQEEVGLRGARTAAFDLDPDLAIAIDVTDTGDTPEARKLAMKLGAGAAIKVKDAYLITPPRVKELLTELAEKNGIPYQFEVLPFGGTDAGAIQLTKAGVPSGVISIPCRYLHSHSEMVDLNDVEAAVRLVVAAMEHPLGG
ncbi:MAG TPA: M42 family metallopeptidase [Firmicutes bacterium]|nr:M42 family metallopeptidase [Bacillota bacterium]